MSDSNSKQRDSDMAFVQQHVDQLMEQFDSVQVFVTRHMPGEMDGTVSINLGAGNWFTRRGQTREWVIVEDERARMPARETNE